MTDRHMTQPTDRATVTIGHARRVMAGILAADLPLPDRLAVGEALSVLSDVHPPYPPLPHPESPEPDVAEAVTDVLALLQLAVRQASGTEEVIRCGSAARVLREHASRLRPPGQPTPGQPSPSQPSAAAHRARPPRGDGYRARERE